jgi:hypothetical protein
MAVYGMDIITKSKQNEQPFAQYTPCKHPITRLRTSVHRETQFIFYTSFESVLATFPCCFQHCLKDSICGFHCQSISIAKYNQQLHYLFLARTPILLLIEAIVQFGVLLCTTRAEDPRVPARTSARIQLQLQVRHANLHQAKRTTHQAHRRPRHYHQACDHFRRWTYCRLDKIIRGVGCQKRKKKRSLCPRNHHHQEQETT